MSGPVLGFRHPLLAHSYGLNFCMASTVAFGSKEHVLDIKVCFYDCKADFAEPIDLLAPALLCAAHHASLQGYELCLFVPVLTGGDNELVIPKHVLQNHNHSELTLGLFDWLSTACSVVLFKQFREFAGLILDFLVSHARLALFRRVVVKLYRVIAVKGKRILRDK